jgi:hypothetical protein
VRISTQPPKREPKERVRLADRSPVWIGWREGTLTHAKELKSLCGFCENDLRADCQAISEAVRRHIEAARQAAEAAEVRPRKWFRSGLRIERAMSNPAAAEAQILNLATPEYVLGQMPSCLCAAAVHAPRRPAGPDRT